MGFTETETKYSNQTLINVFISIPIAFFGAESGSDSVEVVVEVLPVFGFLIGFRLQQSMSFITPKQHRLRTIRPTIEPTRAIKIGPGGVSVVFGLSVVYLSLKQSINVLNSFFKH